LPTDKSQTLAMTLYATVDFLHVVTSFVEKAALALGMAESDALALTLATEEIFVYLCGTSAPDREMKIICTGGGYFVRVDFSLPVDDVNLRAFNLTASVSLEDDIALDEMGLFIAARKVDHFRVTETNGQGIRLALIKEKTYPDLADADLPVPAPSGPFSLRRPDSADAKLFVLMARQAGPASPVPGSFAWPGKVVDQLVAGDVDMIIALDPSGRIGGGILWHWPGPGTVAFFGPYLFSPDPDPSLAEDLLDACISAIAKTHAVALISRHPAEYLPRHRFEKLGSVTAFGGAGGAVSRPTYFRQMQEDAGCVVKVHPGLMAFLEGEYLRLVLPREVVQIDTAGEGLNPFAVLSADVDRQANTVTLRPIRAGTDAADTLAAHVDLFRKESVAGLFFEMDLALPWQVGFTPALLENGFTPRLILPYAGEGDLVVFQWEAGQP